MKLHNVVVQFTVTIPEIEVDKEQGLDRARAKMYANAFEILDQYIVNDDNCKLSITDSPDYPALITQP